MRYDGTVWKKGRGEGNEARTEKSGCGDRLTWGRLKGLWLLS